MCTEVRMFAAPKVIVKILMPKMMVLGGGVFGRCLGHEGEAFMKEISTLIKKDLAEFPNPSCQEEIQ